MRRDVVTPISSRRIYGAEAEGFRLSRPDRRIRHDDAFAVPGEGSVKIVRLHHQNEYRMSI